MSTPANLNGAKPIVDPANAAMLLIDHQSGLFQTIQDMPFSDVRTNATVLAKVASLATIPVITSASVPQGPNGPLIPEVPDRWWPEVPWLSAHETPIIATRDGVVSHRLEALPCESSSG
jgi:nicotinamidase-related amidase